MVQIRSTKQQKNASLLKALKKDCTAMARKGMLSKLALRKMAYILISIALLCCIPLSILVSFETRDENVDPKFILAFRNSILQRKHQQKDIDLKPMPAHCQNVPPITEIIIKGERHTGTNWLRSILQQNVQQDIIVDQTSLDIGWKHGFLPPLGWARPITEHDLVIVQTRDVFTWLPKIFQESYDPEMRAKRRKVRTFAAYLKEEYTCRCQPIQQQKKDGQSKYQKKFCKKIAKSLPWFGIGFDPDKVIAERAKNVIQIRTEKYKQWLSDDPDPIVYSDSSSKEQYLKNRIHVRLEDLASEHVSSYEEARDLQEKVVGDQLLNHCVPIYEHFHEVVERTKWQGYTPRGKNRPFNPSKEKMAMLKRYSKQELRFVLDNLDMEFEKKLGYNYDYVYRLLESDHVPETPRKIPEKRVMKKMRNSNGLKSSDGLAHKDINRALKSIEEQIRKKREEAESNSWI